MPVPATLTASVVVKHSDVAQREIGAALLQAGYGPYLELDVVRGLLLDPTTRANAVQMLDLLVSADKKRTEAEAEAVFRILSPHLRAPLYSLLTHNLAK